MAGSLGRKATRWVYLDILNVDKDSKPQIIQEVPLQAIFGLKYLLSLDDVGYLLALALKLLEALHGALPKMSLIASDFNYLPDVKVPGVRAPLVSTQMHKKYTVHSVAIGKDTFVVTLNPNVDHAFIVTLIVILHEINEEKDAAM
ncbi:protein LURP-one-related 15 [Tanacetum coccineum]